MLVDDGPKQWDACALSLMLGAWIAWALRYTFGAEHPNLGLTVSRLLAGIALLGCIPLAERMFDWFGHEPAIQRLVRTAWLLDAFGDTGMISVIICRELADAPVKRWEIEFACLR